MSADTAPGFPLPDHQGHFLQPDFTYSVPAGEPREGMYQIVQLILQKNNPRSKPEFFDALLSDDPQKLFDFLGISFPVTETTVNSEKIESIRERYDGESHVVPFIPNELAFTLATAHGFKQSLHFVGSACVQSIQYSAEGKPAQLILDRMNPYFIHYFVVPSLSESDIPLSDYARKHLDRGMITSLEDESEFEAVYRFNIQIFNTVRGFMNASRASSGSLYGLSDLSQ
ncbi:MAG: hypothetical protein NUV98_03455 [Candidatus Roizmanbacteria bacterium]|nr:hypothetical protein [Candidatus Roizmanbacteria bacterium]